jgi:hypothetical protein
LRGKVDDKAIDILNELFTGGLFFKHPPLIPITIIIAASISALWFYRWKKWLRNFEQCDKWKLRARCWA